MATRGLSRGAPAVAKRPCSTKAGFLASLDLTCAPDEAQR